MLKLVPRSEQKNLPDARGCYKLKHYAQMLIIGGVPLAACILVPLIFDPPDWIYAVCIAAGGIWYAIISLVVTDQARAEFLEEEKQSPCPNCGYSLVGLPVLKCPECGIDWSPRKPADNAPSTCNPDTNQPNNTI